MKIGDKVRFLSEVGGGRVKAFQGKDVVLVEDEDGFEIPMLRSQVVLIDTDDYNIAKVNTRDSVKKPQSSLRIEEEELEPCEKPITFKPKPLERKEGNRMNLFLSFLPNEVKEISTTTFECYLVNDSNYYVQVLYMSGEGSNWRARFCAVVEPNSKLFVEEFDRSVINELERVCVQAIAWKQDKLFALKPAYTVEMRIDGTKFYKLHTFRPNEFFADPNWTLPIIQDDKPIRSLFVDAEQLREGILSSGNAKPLDGKPSSAAKPKEVKAADAPLEVNLHIEELMDTTNGLSSGDILMAQMNEFRKVMDANIKQKGKKIVFIHGKGEGVLRKNILQELKYRYKGCVWQDASFREYGFGATLVKIG